MVIELAAKGFNVEAFAGHIRVSIDTIYEWLHVHPSFSEAKKIADAVKHYYLQDIGLKGMQGQIKDFNSTTYIWFTKNSLGWRDAQDINIKHEHKLDPELANRLHRQLAEDYIERNNDLVIELTANKKELSNDGNSRRNTEKDK
jgi:hypothetical protein